MSKKNRKPKTYTMRSAQIARPPKPERSTPKENTEFGTDLDAAFSEWIVEEVWERGQSRDRAIAAAISLWLGRNDPNFHSLRQCWVGSYFVQQLILQYGIKSTVATVSTEVLHNGVRVGAVGLVSPGKAGSDGMWDGHAVLVIPEISMMIDLTIGQASYLEQKLDWQLPAIKVDPLFASVPSPGTQVLVEKNAKDGISIRYTFGSQSPDYERSTRGRALIADSDRGVLELLQESAVGLLPFLDVPEATALQRSLSRL